ncbi:MAG TPA: hypothetical protein VMF58_15130 [Rhizomicrobium sp.]|nr:hypothetical protein [Rhizomicrobium sp.]
MAVTNILLAAATAVGLVGGGVMAVDAARSADKYVRVAEAGDQVAAQPRRIIIGIDLSKSNPLIDNPPFAAKIAARVANEVRSLGFASEVHVRTFGNFDASSNTFAYDTMISTHARPEAVAAEIQKLIAGTPMLVERGKWVSQNNTNIIAFMDNAVQSIGCSGMPTTVILASDGIEDSEYARLDREDARLPAPDGHPFRGCAELQILGVGQGTRSPTETTRLRAQWMRWAQEAGFAHFLGLNDW